MFCIILYKSDKSISKLGLEVSLSFLLCKNWNVLCFSPWYKNEEGVETRRALGLMGALALVSQYAAQYMSGKCRLASYTEGP
jgi:hypothetical protein